MAFFKRSKGRSGASKRNAAGKPGGGSDESAARGSANPKAPTSDASGQTVGIVSGVLTTGARPGESTPFSDVVARRFGPDAASRTDSSAAPGTGVPPQAEALEEPLGRDVALPSSALPSARSASSASPTRPPGSGAAHRQAEDAAARRPGASELEPLFSDDTETPELEVDPMANIGRATTITGNIVAEEDLEIHGTIEGSVRLAAHQVTVGSEGLVKASVEARIVLVHGKITGDVTASDLVEVEPGGVIGGDVKAPRVIMHDGAVIVGGLDMSAALPSSGAGSEKSTAKSSEESGESRSDRPALKRVDLPPVREAKASAAPVSELPPRSEKRQDA